MRSAWARLVLIAAATAGVGCQHGPAIFTAVLESPKAIQDVGRLADRARSRGPGSPPTPSEEEVAVLEEEHGQRMRPLQSASAALLAGEAYWVRGTARFLVVLRTEQGVLGLEVAETAAGSRINVICPVPSECLEGSVKLRVETMRWLRANKLASAEPAPSQTLPAADLRWQAPSVYLLRDEDAAPLRSLPNGATPYAVAISADGALALLRVRTAAGEQVTVVRIPETTPDSAAL